MSNILVFAGPNGSGKQLYDNSIVAYKTAKDQSIKLVLDGIF